MRRVRDRWHITTYVLTSLACRSRQQNACTQTIRHASRKTINPHNQTSRQAVSINTSSPPWYSPSSLLFQLSLQRPFRSWPKSHQFDRESKRCVHLGRLRGTPLNLTVTSDQPLYRITTTINLILTSGRILVNCSLLDGSSHPLKVSNSTNRVVNHRHAPPCIISFTDTPMQALYAVEHIHHTSHDLHVLIWLLIAYVRVHG